MATKKEIANALKDLSASQGGSLVKEVVKAKMKDEPVIFISLGGLGGKTLDKLESTILREYETNTHCAFLAIDTAVDDLKSLKTPKLNERFDLFDPTCVQLPSNPPEYAKAWLNKDFPKNDLSSKGAEGVRQVARLMLCGTRKYDDLRARIVGMIHTVMEDCAAPITINLIAGISGGTGSGTIIDIAYMIHDIMAQLGIFTYQLRGFLYLADAQKHITSIGNTPSIWQSLERNCYAALKEIDYFMSNGTDGATDPIYYLQTANREVKSSKKIFKVGNCILVSSVMKNTAVTNYEEIVERFANFISYIFTDMSGNLGEAQDIMSNLVNVTRNQLENWKTIHINPGSDNPSWACYHYSAIGYSSLYIPRDEIFAYCANLVFENMYEDWNNITLLTQENIDQQLVTKGLDSLDNVFRFIKKRMKEIDSINKIKLRIGKEDAAYPEIQKVLGIGKTKNTDATMQEAAERANRVNKSLGTPATMDALVDSIIKSVINDVNTYFEEKGPFFAIAMLSGLENSKIKGFTQRFNEYKSGIPEKEKALIQKMKAAKQLMEDEEVKRRKDMVPTDEETEDFVSVCERYTNACIDVYLIKRFAAILDKVYAGLNDVNSRTYKVYTTTLEVLSEMLHNDSVFATDAARTINGKGEKFSFDAIGFKQSAEMRKKFERLFESVLDDEHAKLLAIRFKDNMFSEKTMKAWEAVGEDQELFANNIRSIFISFFSDYTSNTLEKFLVLANNEIDPKITPQRLTEIWEASESVNADDYSLKQELINNAADSIYRQLHDNSSIMIRSIIGAGHVDTFIPFGTTCLISTMPNINDAIKTLHPNDTYTVADKDFRSSITRFELVTGIPAATIYGMNEYAEAYYTSESPDGSCIGRHMDESSQNWDRYLPEIYGIDANRFYSTEKSCVHKIGLLNSNNFREYALYDKIKKCFSSGLRNGWIGLNNEANHYAIYRVVSVRDNYESFRSKLKKALNDDNINNPAEVIWPLVEQCNGEIAVSVTNIVPVDMLDCELDITQLPPNDYEISDVHRLIRGNMNLMKALFDAYNEYSSDNSIIGVYETEKGIYSSNEDVRRFVLMICNDLIKYDKTNELWMYRLEKDSPNYELLLQLNNGMTKFDKEAIYYLGFVGYLTSDVKSEIDIYLSKVTTHIASQEVFDAAKKFLDSKWMNNLVEKKKLEDLENEVSRSPYKLLYNYPYKANGYDSTFNNLDLFYKQFMYYLDQYLQN